MVQIHKSHSVPDVLLKKGTVARVKMEQLFQSGLRQFDFRKDKIYSAKSVKEALMKCQHDKCCFCEEKIGHIAFGHVEHYRPKGGCRQAESEPSSSIGYFWLAYDWDNLFFCCEICNVIYKRDFFPLKDPARRALGPEDNLDQEFPLILHPSSDPSPHIEFHVWAIREKNNSEVGMNTINRTGLDRPKLVKERRDYFEAMVLIVESIFVMRSKRRNSEEEVALLQNLEAYLKKSMLPNARYSAMIRDNFAHLV